MKFIKKILKFILDLLFPLRCLGCRREDFWLCPACFEKLPLDPSYERFEKILVFSASDYEKIIIKKIIKTCKFSAIQELAQVAGKLLVRSVLKFPEIKDLLQHENDLLIVPISLSPRRQRERSFNQSLLIAQELSEHFSLPIIDGLKKIERQPQSELAAEKRSKNIANAFSWQGENLAGQKIILVDDVVTTGATLAEAAKVLKKAGAKKVIGLAVAR
jgi:ComF family protein